MSENNTAKKKKKIKSKASTAVFVVIIVILAGVMCFAGYKVISALTTYDSAKNYYDDVREMFEVEEEETDIDETMDIKPGETATTSGGQAKVKKFRFDFSKLTAINQDAVGYLKARGKSGDDVIDYPVVQGYDNSYYLTHMFNGESNKSGAIFMDCDIDERFESRNCIIYGHNMYAGAKMFSCLEHYSDPAYAKEHAEMDVYTPDKHYVYRVFTAFTADTSGFAYQYGFADDADFMNFIKKALDVRPFDMGLNLEDFTPESKIMTLSTCLTDYRSDKRFVIMLLRTEELD